MLDETSTTPTTAAPDGGQSADESTQAAPEVTSGAPAPDGTSAPTNEATPEAESFHELSFDDVPEEARPYARHVEAQLKGSFTRKTQELAELRKEAEQALDLQRRLGSEETRQEALAELLAEHGYELPDEDGEYVDESDLEEDPGYRDPRVDELLAEREAEAQARREADAGAAVDHTIRTALTAYEQEIGEELSDRDKQLILAYAVQFTQPGELPNMEAALAEHREYTTGLQQQAVTRYLRTKRVPNADASGSSGAPDNTPRTAQQRQELAMQVAGRHY